MPAPQPAARDRILAAAGLVTTYAFMLGFSDNYVRVVAAESGLWQFHLSRGLIAMALMLVLARLIGMKLRPKRLWAVAVRGGLQGFGVLIYFAAIAVLPVPVAAAGLFTAPIFVLLISALIFGERIGPVSILAVIMGFLGVLLVLGPSAFSGVSLVTTLLPVAGGLVYAFAMIATRRLCAEEEAGALVAAFFIALGLFGIIGLIVLQIWPLQPEPGPAGFVARGWVMPDLTYLAWMTMHAGVVALGTWFCTRAYLIADTGRVSVMEYVMLPAAAFWGYAIWGEVLGWQAWVGIALIAIAGGLITLAPKEAGAGLPAPQPLP